MVICTFSTTPYAYAGDCLEASILTKRNMQEQLFRMKDVYRTRTQSADDHALGMGHHEDATRTMIEIQNELIDLYSNAAAEKCEGQVLTLYNRLKIRAKRKRNNKRKAFDLPTCATLMARINMGRAYDFCPDSNTMPFDVNYIRRSIEKENRRRK